MTRIARFFSKSSGMEVKLGRKFVKRGDREVETGCVVLRIFPLEKGRAADRKTMVLTGSEAFLLGEELEKLSSSEAEENRDLFVHKSNSRTAILSIASAKNKAGKLFLGIRVSYSKNDRLACWLSPSDARFLAAILRDFAVKTAYETEVEAETDSGMEEAPGEEELPA